jgi:hypothetical protein
MVRIILCIGSLLFVVTGCGEDDECSGFGCPTGSATAADDGASTGASDPTVDPTADPTTVDDGEVEDDDSASASASTTDEPTTDASASASDTTAAPEGTSSADDESTTAPPCDGADCPVLFECFGIDIWESCTQYCEASKATCVENGCDGVTVVYYGDAQACIDSSSNGSASQSCDAAFDVQGGGVSFGRCCCDE